MVIEQCGFFNMPNLLWHEPTLYNGHLWGPVILTSVVEGLAVELSITVFRLIFVVLFRPGIKPHLPHMRRPLYHYATVPIKSAIVCSVSCIEPYLTPINICVSQLWFSGTLIDHHTLYIWTNLVHVQGMRDLLSLFICHGNHPLCKRYHCLHLPRIRFFDLLPLLIHVQWIKIANSIRLLYCLSVICDTSPPLHVASFKSEMNYWASWPATILYKHSCKTK